MILKLLKMGKRKNRNSMSAFAEPSNYFNANNQINKYHLDHSTFDLMDVDRFHNTDGKTVFSYVMTWILMILSWVLLGVDMYTCLTILVFHKWSNDSYKPYAYSVAKWIFTGCIIFEFCLLLYHWIWAIHTYRTRNIALAYVNKICRLMYVVRSYNYHCLFHKIEQENFFDWACFLTYHEIDNAPQILLADTPRQVINILTLRYYATNGETSNDIVSNIKDIADTNIILSIVLSFMLLSVAIWSIFFFKFVFGMLLYIPVKAKLRNKKFKSLKKYCCTVVNDNVRTLVFTNHKPKNELLEKGILDLKDINANPLLSSSTTNLSTYNPDQNKSSVDGFPYRGIPHSGSSSSLVPKNYLDDNQSYRYNDNKKLYNIAKNGSSVRNPSYESLPLDNLKSRNIPYSSSNLRNVYSNPNNSSHSLKNPFDDFNKSLENLTQPPKAQTTTRKAPPPFEPSNAYQPVNPFQDPNWRNDSFEQPQVTALKNKASMNTINSNTYTIDDSSFMSQSNQQQSNPVLPTSLAETRTNSQSSLTFTQPAVPAPSIPRSTSVPVDQQANPFEYVPYVSNTVHNFPEAQPLYQYQEFGPRSTSISSSEFQESRGLLPRTSSQGSNIYNSETEIPRSDSHTSELSYPLRPLEEIDSPIQRVAPYEAHDLDDSSPITLKQLDNQSGERNLRSNSDDSDSDVDDLIHPTTATNHVLTSKESKSTLNYDKFTEMSSAPYPIPDSEDESDLDNEDLQAPPAPYPVRGVSMFAEDEVDDKDKRKLSDLR